MRHPSILDPSEINRYVSDGVYYIVRRTPKRPAQSVLLSIGPEKPKCSCVVVRRLDAFPSLPGIVPHRKKERRAPARPVGPLT